MPHLSPVNFPLPLPQAFVAPRSSVRRTNCLQSPTVSETDQYSLSISSAAFLPSSSCLVTPLATHPMHAESRLARLCEGVEREVQNHPAGSSFRQQRRGGRKGSTELWSVMGGYEEATEDCDDQSATHGIAEDSRASTEDIKREMEASYFTSDNVCSISDGQTLENIDVGGLGRPGESDLLKRKDSLASILGDPLDCMEQPADEKWVHEAEDIIDGHCLRLRELWTRCLHVPFDSRAQMVEEIDSVLAKLHVASVQLSFSLSIGSATKGTQSANNTAVEKKTCGDKMLVGKGAVKITGDQKRSLDNGELLRESLNESREETVVISECISPKNERDRGFNVVRNHSAGNITAVSKMTEPIVSQSMLKPMMQKDVATRAHCHGSVAKPSVDLCSPHVLEKPEQLFHGYSSAKRMLQQSKRSISNHSDHYNAAVKPTNGQNGLEKQLTIMDSPKIAAGGSSITHQAAPHSISPYHQLLASIAATGYVSKNSQVGEKLSEPIHSSSGKVEDSAQLKATHSSRVSTSGSHHNRIETVTPSTNAALNTNTDKGESPSAILLSNVVHEPVSSSGRRRRLMRPPESDESSDLSPEIHNENRGSAMKQGKVGIGPGETSESEGGLIRTPRHGFLSSPAHLPLLTKTGQSKESGNTGSGKHFSAERETALRGSISKQDARAEHIQHTEDAGHESDDDIMSTTMGAAHIYPSNRRLPSYPPLATIARGRLSGKCDDTNLQSGVAPKKGEGAARNELGAQANMASNYGNLSKRRTTSSLRTRGETVDVEIDELKVGGKLIDCPLCGAAFTLSAIEAHVQDDHPEFGTYQGVEEGRRRELGRRRGMGTL